MREIDYSLITKEVAELCERICRQLPADVTEAISESQKKETDPGAKKILSQLLQNAETALEKNIPLCQDTGLVVGFINQGTRTLVTNLPDEDKTITDAVNEGIAAGYEKGYLRKSIVAEPLKERQNTGTNTPAVIHFTPSPGDRLEITLMAKGGGCENKSQFKMFNPTDELSQITEWITQVVEQAGANACPPFVIGVGIGGDFEYCCLISKKALLSRMGRRHPDPFYAQMEEQLLKKINSLNIGPQGLGGKTTALAVHIETAPCHIASLPVAVNIECHSHRHGTIVI